MPSATAGSPLKRTSLRSSSAPTSTRPTSRSRTGPGVGLGEDQLVVLLGGLHLAERAHGELALAALDPARRDVDVLALQRGRDVGDRQRLAGEPRVVDPDPHRVAPLAGEPDLGDARQLARAGPGCASRRASRARSARARRRRARSTGSAARRRCCLAITGSSTSCGRVRRARATRSRTSAAAASTSRYELELDADRETCSRETEVTCLMPSMPISWSSSGCVTEVSTTSGAAPG